MARLIILIAVAGIALILWHKISKAKGDEKKKLVFWSIIGGVLAVLGLLGLLEGLTGPRAVEEPDQSGVDVPDCIRL